MGLAETAQLLVKLTLQDDASGTADKVKGSLGDMGKVALGVAGAAGFGALTKGALDAEAAQGKFMAATGKSREEAKQFVSSMDGLAGSAGAVGLSFDQITQTGTEVAVQFGLTGQEGQDMTEKFLEFAKVTGQDATGAVGDFDAVLDAFKLPASAANGLMDQLVASHQKYGTEAGPAAADALLKMAPALQGLNLGLDEGVGLLNLFEDNGLSADAAMRGLQTAVKNLKPGQTFDDLIAEVSSVEDPTERAQKAMELFGTKAGSGLALALHPGVTSIDNWKISVGEAAGKTGKAADDMLTFTDRIKGWGEKAAAGAREIGQSFGPAITGLASLGSLAAPFSSKMIDVIKDIGGRILPQAAATGLATGVAMAEGEAEGAGGASAIGKIGARIGAMSIPLAASGTTVGTAVGSAMSLGMAAGFAVAGAAVINLPAILDHLTGTDATSMYAGIGKFAADHFADGYSEEAKSTYAAAFQQAWEAARASGAGADEAAQAGKDAADKYLTGFVNEGLASHAASERVDNAMVQMGSVAETAAEPAGEKVGETFGHAVTTSGGMAISDGWRTVARNTASMMQHTLAAGLLDSLPNMHSAWKQYIEDAKHELDPMKEIAWIQARLTGDKLAAGLASKNPLERERALQIKKILEDRLNELGGIGLEAGTDAGQGVAAGLNNTTASAATQASQLAAAVNANLAKIKTNIQIVIKGDEQYGHGHGKNSYAVGAWNIAQAETANLHEGEMVLPKAVAEPFRKAFSLPLPHPYNPPNSFQPMPIAVSVSLSTRGVDREMDHYRYIQGRTR